MAPNVRILRAFLWPSGHSELADRVALNTRMGLETENFTELESKQGFPFNLRLPSCRITDILSARKLLHFVTIPILTFFNSLGAVPALRSA